MRPDTSRTLQGIAINLLTNVIAEVKTPFGQQTVGIAASLAMWIAEETERGADRLVVENGVTREILADGLALAGTARAAVEAAAATPAGPPPQTMTSVSILTGKVREYVTCPLRTAGVSARTPNGIPLPIAATAAPFKNPRLSIPVSFQNPMLSVVQKSPFIRFSMAHLDPIRPAGQTGHRFLSRIEDFGIWCKDNLIGDNWFC